MSKRISRHRRFLNWAACCALGAGALAVPTSTAFADFFDPCSKYRVGSKKWKKCKATRFVPGADLGSADERFMAAYWLAKSGRYQGVLTVLAPMANSNDARVHNYIGFATRKLGDVKRALVSYRKAIALNPDYVLARAYMGEAYLTLGDRVSAEAQLDEIAKRCGVSCDAFSKLRGALDGRSTL